MAFGLRHHPEEIGISLDEHGWADCSELIQAVNRRYPGFTRDDLERIVAKDEKQRYAFSEDGTRIRASQGHSIPVDVELTQSVPPKYLFHGTGEKHVPAIEQEGLKHMSRLYVHLSWDRETALKVGSRHGKPVVFKVHAGKMQEDGYVFFLSANNVWLTESVPVQYLERI